MLHSIMILRIRTLRDLWIMILTVKRLIMRRRKIGIRLNEVIDLGILFLFKNSFGKIRFEFEFIKNNYYLFKFDYEKDTQE